MIYAEQLCGAWRLSVTAIFVARPETSDIMCRYNLSSLLLLCSNDVETNPGPLTPLARGPNLEKAVTDLK